MQLNNERNNDYFYKENHFHYYLKYFLINFININYLFVRAFSNDLENINNNENKIIKKE